MPNVALIITAYNRPELLQQCLDSLLRADLSKVSEILVHDDKSTDPNVRRIAADFMVQVKNFHWWYNDSDETGIKAALLRCYEWMFSRNEYCINLDADAIVKPDFITRLLELKARWPECIISGFNCQHPKNPVLRDDDNYVTRQHCNGINMLIDKQQYEQVIRPALLASGNWDFNSTHKWPFVITKPSVVQHIGAHNSTMGHAHGDVACDFKLLSLPRVCLFGIDAHDPEGIKRAADICTRDVEFEAVKIITERLFSGREAYSKFMIADLHGHLPPGDYTHVLTIHPDGYIQKPEAWSDEFLQYDYIGAKWLYHDGMVCGNGGFSLRSRKFIELCSRLDITDYHPEDDKLCRKYRPFLEKEYGVKYAPAEVCDKFSIEAYGCSVMVDSSGIPANQYCGQFGFHGIHVKGLPVPLPPKPVKTRLHANNNSTRRRY